ncbi:MAG: hypothetical protein HOI47_05810 [Candidatus Scalindua sp.]|nr:hypothetical protein [Candidatus Scalindua sp.]
MEKKSLTKRNSVPSMLGSRTVRESVGLSMVKKYIAKMNMIPLFVSETCVLHVRSGLGSMINA